MKEKILIVDDVYANRYLIEEILIDYEVFGVSSGDAMRRFFIRNLPDLIIMDVMMPEEDGFQLAKELSSNDKYKNVPIIFVTAKSTKAAVIEGYKSGGYDYIRKPFDDLDLIKRVQDTLLKKRIENAEKKA